MKRRFVFYLFIILIIAVNIFPVKDIATAKTSINSNYKEISVVMDDSYPPYVFRDVDGNLKGILIDQWALWEKKTGIKVNITAMNWDTALYDMKDNSYDVIDTIFSNSAREATLDFTEPYVKIEVPIFFHKNISGITDVNSLKGFTVAVKKGDNCINILKEKGIDMVEYDNYNEIIDAVAEKKVVVFIMDKPPALYYLYKNKMENSFNYTKPIYTGEFHRAVKKGNSELLSTIENGFTLISKNEYNEIDKKWYGTNELSIAYLKYLNIFKYAAIIIAVIILVLVLLNYSLKRIVNKRTSELKEAINRMKTIIKVIPDIFYVLNKDGVFIDCLSDEEDNGNYPNGYFIGKSISDVFPADISEKFLKSFNKLGETGNIQIYEYSLEINNKLRYDEARLVNFGDYEILLIVREITERKIAEKKIYEISVYDSLTGLYNRNYFENEIVKFEKGNLSNVGLVICDIDGLKLVNDTMGHPKGDQYIIIASQVLRSCFRRDDIIARIGGDEFAVLMKNTSEAEIENIKKTVKNMTDSLSNETNLIPVSISLGYSVSKDSTKKINDIYKEADDHMYREKLYNLQSPRSKNVEILMKMLEARDFLTEGHGERLMKVAGILSKASGMSENEIEDIKLLSQFHDIGKIGIPDAILFKPGKLSDEERVIMKRHSDIGYRIAQASSDIMHISDWILKHHERWDGSGYPFGLKGKEIPIQCRILAIVDSYDAMTNDRPYRKAMSKQDAIREIELCAGTQFDPYLANIFIKLI